MGQNLSQGRFFSGWMLKFSGVQGDAQPSRIFHVHLWWFVAVSAINNYWSKAPCLSLLIQLQGCAFISPGHIQTIPSKYLWRWTAMVHICPELEMFPNIPAMYDIILLTWANPNYPSCKQDVKRAMRRLRTTFPKPSGGGSWGSGSRTWIYTETSHIQKFCRRKVPTSNAAGMVHRPGMGCRTEVQGCVRAPKNVSSIPLWCFEPGWRLGAHQSCSQSVRHNPVWASHGLTASFRHPPAPVWGLQVISAPPWAPWAAGTQLPLPGLGISALVPGADPALLPQSPGICRAVPHLSSPSSLLAAIFLHSNFFLPSSLCYPRSAATSDGLDLGQQWVHPRASWEWGKLLETPEITPVASHYWNLTMPNPTQPEFPALPSPQPLAPWKPQPFSAENKHRFKIPGATEGKILEMSAWVCVPSKTTELVSNNGYKITIQGVENDSSQVPSRPGIHQGIRITSQLLQNRGANPSNNIAFHTSSRSSLALCSTTATFQSCQQEDTSFSKLFKAQFILVTDECSLLIEVV